MQFFFWLSLRTLHLKTYFLGGEKQRLEIHLHSQATEIMAVLIKVHLYAITKQGC